ncbi:hypothetical protein [Mycolicibacterium arenosum]|uniref:PPE family domain-containing protein n=1 Tax=Mycolicibacterium arenosum TaxID=2952157 RepID=A0ABT1MBG0_9MYCO|nr:hypothetical protein [Mycolicibacterium sp. CAU 1645]MCP9276486.1 hypothetical protein [Mycolicibacterium sp. CAU 1645]
MSTRVDTDGLRTAGHGLTQTATDSPGAPPHCPPATSDHVSVSAAETLNRWSSGLWTLLQHADGLRRTGGASVVAASDLICHVDTANARMIARVADGGAASAPTVPTLPGETLGAPAPLTPTDPGAAALPPSMSAEEIAAHVHAGPGTGHLRAFAAHWRDTVAPLIQQAADETRAHGSAINTHWEDGWQRAAVNVAEHADWLESVLHPAALRLADAAERVAEHTDAVIRDTPRPEELDDLTRRYNAALADYRASGGLDAAPAVALGAEWTRTREATVAGYQTFAAAAAVNPKQGPPPLRPGPAIVRPGGPSRTPAHSPDAPSPRTPVAADDDGGAHGGEDHGGDGSDPEELQASHSAQPAGPGGPPPSGPTPPLAATTATGTTTAPGTVANIAGAVTGAGIGAIGQLANGLHGLTGGASPMSALSGLSPLPGLGGGQPPVDAPLSTGDGGGSGGPESPDVGDFGSGGTAAASGGGGAAPVSSSSPVVSGASAASPSVGTPSIAAQTSTGPTGFAGGGMYAPPMAGGLGRGEDPSKSEDTRRVVHRPVPNTEPVFGEVERRRTSRRADKREEPT